LWALRGGGGNFGVITELAFALQPLGPTVTGGIRLYPYEQAGAVLRSYRDVMAEAPSSLCGGVTLMTAPPAPFVPTELHGKPVVILVVLWAGPADDAVAGIAPLAALGKPIADLVGPMPYTEVQKISDPSAPPGHRDYFKGGFMTELSDGAIDTIVGLAGDFRAPLTQIICAPLGAGTAYAAVGEEHSAIGHRDEGWSFQVLSLWADRAEDSEQKDWTRAAAEAMSSYSALVSYPNFLSADEPGDVQGAYTPSVYSRLVAVKDQYDPGNIFRINNNIPPSAGNPGR
jgi:FAD/FMN-containing dehydrogenase